MRHHLCSIVSFAFLAAAAPGCLQGVESESDPAAGEQAILNGTTIPAADSGIVTVTAGSTTCTGFLITNNWVLTAKQCVSNVPQSNPGSVVLAMGAQSASALEIVFHHNQDAALIRTLGFQMNGSSTGFDRAAYRSSLTGQSLQCRGYGIGSAGGAFGTLRRASFVVQANGQIVTTAGALPAAGDAGAPCFYIVAGVAEYPAGMISSCTSSSCTLTPMPTIRSWIAETRTVKELVPTNSGRCMEVPLNSFTPGTGITQRACTNVDQQKWRFERLNSNVNGPNLHIRAKHSGFCLTVPPGGGIGTQVVQQPCTTTNDNQGWLVSASGTGHVIQGAPFSSASGLCLDVRGAATGDGGILQVSNCNGQTNQLFGVRVEPEEGSFELSHAGNGNCIDVPVPSDDGEENLQTHPCHLGTNQQIRFERPAGTTGGTLVPHFVHSGLCMDVEGNSMDPGAPIQQWLQCNGGTNQRFRLLYGGEGNYRLQSLSSQLCAAVVSGVAITQQTCATSNNNTWRLAE